MAYGSSCFLSSLWCREWSCMKPFYRLTEGSVSRHGSTYLFTIQMEPWGDFPSAGWDLEAKQSIVKSKTVKKLINKQKRPFWRRFSEDGGMFLQHWNKCVKISLPGLGVSSELCQLESFLCLSMPPAGRWGLQFAFKYLGLALGSDV